MYTHSECGTTHPDDATPLVNKTNKDGVGGGDNELSLCVCVCVCSRGYLLCLRSD